MGAGFLPLPGEPAPPGALTAPKALETVRLLAAGTNPYARLVECRTNTTADIVVLDVEVQLPQHRLHDIRRHERTAAVFPRDDEQRPDVLALRPDFPLVPHLNLQLTERPRSLCLYDRLWPEIRLDWTAPTFVELIRAWLALTAQGRLHGDDQPLEPLLPDGIEDLVMPSDLFNPDLQKAHPLAVVRVPSGNKRWTYIAHHPSSAPTDRDREPQFIGIVVTSNPRVHGVIHSAPKNLAELHDYMASADGDVLGTLRARFRDWPSEEFQALQGAYPIIILHLPKTRSAGAPPENTEVRAFVALATVKEVGQAIDAWGITAGHRGLLLHVDDTKRGQEIQIHPLNPRRTLSRSFAANLNAVAPSTPLRISAIGVGALGSQVVLNLVRSGFGQWTLIDDDIMLPHNAARHALDGHFVGQSKAEALAAVANRTIDSGDIARAVVANVWRPGEQGEELLVALRESDLILDMSASIAVARYLTRGVESPARRASAFLNPSGTGLTLLVEDASRRAPLDLLEMQFYRQLIDRSELTAFLDRTDGAVRAGQSCRDTSARMPQDLVALHAGIASRALRKAIEAQDATIRAWRVDEHTQRVDAVEVVVAEPVTQRARGWTICTDSHLLQSVVDLRSRKLPNETGGVLVGHFDMTRKIAYVVDAVPSPPDSKEWPTVYIRGCRGLRNRISEIGRATGGMLEYVGEWHSHPDGSGTSPSPDDGIVLGWLAKYMDPVGRPGILAIVGEGRQLAFYVNAAEINGRAAPGMRKLKGQLDSASRS